MHYCCVWDAYSTVLDGWTEYKLVRQFLNPLFSVLYTLPQTPSHSLTQQRLINFRPKFRQSSPDLKSWPWSWPNCFLKKQLLQIISESILTYLVNPSTASVIAALQHHKPWSIHNRSLLHTTSTTQLCHSAWKSDPTYAAVQLIAQFHAVYTCAQTWFPQLLIFPFFPYVSRFDPPPSPPMHSSHSQFRHTQPHLFVYAAIFSNRASERYTAGGKHGVRRWTVGVLSLLFVYRSFPCSLQAREINDDGDNLRNRVLLLY